MNRIIICFVAASCLLWSGEGLADSLLLTCDISKIPSDPISGLPLSKIEVKLVSNFDQFKPQITHQLGDGDRIEFPPIQYRWIRSNDGNVTWYTSSENEVDRRHFVGVFMFGGSGIYILTESISAWNKSGRPSEHRIDIKCIPEDVQD